jgi:hypothetical protein
VYVGCVWQEYQLLLEHLRVPPTVHVLTGSGMNFMIGRVSYTFGLQGVDAVPANMPVCHTVTWHPVSVTTTLRAAHPTWSLARIACDSRRASDAN